MAMTYGKGKECKQYWIVRISTKGFESTMLMYGTMSEMWKYMESELGYTLHYRYDSASNEEVTMAKKLGIKIYIC